MVLLLQGFEADVRSVRDNAREVIQEEIEGVLERANKQSQLYLISILNFLNT